MPPEKKIFRKRCHRYDIPGHHHFLTFSCFKRQPFLTRDRSCRWLADAILAATEKHQFDLLAYVFMPEHVHLMIHPRIETYRIRAILSSIKLPVAIHARNWVLANAPTFLQHMLDEQPNGKRTVRFWQRGGGHDRNIFTADELWEKIHYIHQNPVRRKLVTRAADWPWSSAADYAKIRQGPLPIVIPQW